nr:PREDICTED: kremen protein 1 [Latimeria chalumnae]|eukprot:XP_005993354.1 PREDICTED: kremen protein 1 [Latimeria chalumnae]
MDLLAAFLIFLPGFALTSSFDQFHSECFTVNGVDYRGSQNQTTLHGGKPCLFWNETFQHPYNTLRYRNGEGGLGDHNYCRNPDGDVRPWCYIPEHEDSVYWKYCDIPTCQMPGYLGCFKDSGDPPPLSGSSETSNKLTVQMCISFCRSLHFKFAGMESGYACFCGNNGDYRRHGEVNSTECNNVCFGDHTQPCGGDGRVIIFSTSVGACGGNYTSESGIIYSPDFPDNYASSRVCYWTIQIPGASRVQFNFTLFDIRDNSDMVELLDGYTNRVLFRYDGRNRPTGTVNISQDFVILYFYSDRLNQAQGFVVLYKALKDHLPPAEDKSKHNVSASQEVIEEASVSRSTGKSSKILYVITSSPSRPSSSVPGWIIYILAALVTLTIIAMVAKILLHATVKSHGTVSPSGKEDPGQSSTVEFWSILYKPATSISISIFKQRLKNQEEDRSPLVRD